MKDWESLDRIYIRDLALRCIIGVNREERRRKQDVVVNVVLFADLRKACASDRMADTVDYKAIKGKIVAAVESSRYALVERLAGRVAQIALAPARVRAVRVRVEKPGALRYARTVGVEITREKADGGGQGRKRRKENRA